ncbi:hypothetical protein, partial [Fertoeibacter niger]|uniref:hypothetical protein n=1 Tax=Fertoeibacter niger TaxID=2656921 RepID=UPI001C2D0487
MRPHSEDSSITRSINQGDDDIATRATRRGGAGADRYAVTGSAWIRNVGDGYQPAGWRKGDQPLSGRRRRAPSRRISAATVATAIIRQSAAFVA